MTIHFHAPLHSRVSTALKIDFGMVSPGCPGRLVSSEAWQHPSLGSDDWGWQAFYLRFSNENQNVHVFKQRTPLHQILPKHTETSQAVFLCSEETPASLRWCFWGADSAGTRSKWVPHPTRLKRLSRWNRLIFHIWGNVWLLWKGEVGSSLCQ